LVSYGLRAREVAALTLDDIDWERDRLLVPERKAGHCTAYPLSRIVGEALCIYLEQARPRTEERILFRRAYAPYVAMTHHSVSSRAVYYLRKAGIKVHRPGSHTLRHTCVQRLIDADFSLKSAGDYVGHGSPQSTEIYTKIDVEKLRIMAFSDGEDLL
jgi:integrase